MAKTGQGGFKRRTKKIHELTKRETNAAIANRMREVKRLGVQDLQSTSTATHFAVSL